MAKVTFIARNSHVNYYHLSGSWDESDREVELAARVLDLIGDPIAAFKEPKDKAEGNWTVAQEEELRHAVRAEINSWGNRRGIQLSIQWNPGTKQLEPETLVPGSWTGNSK